MNRKRVQRLMRLMGIAALGPKPRTSKPAPGHKIYPYLLRDVTIERANHVWAADITYIPIGRGFLYLVAIIDWASRAVLAWRLSNTMDVSFCLAALEEALAKFGRPEIFNTDQGSQFTSAAFTGALAEAGVDDLHGRPRPLDGQRVHRAAVAVAQVRGRLPQGLRRRPGSARGIAEWIAFYNDRRPHQALADRAPMAVWREAVAGAKAVDMMDNASALPTCPQRQTADAASCCVIERNPERSRSPTNKPPQAVPLRGSISEHRKTSFEKPF